MPSPRVSVICIFYDAERFIREAIDSVIAQEFRDFELILVDDGSSDGSTQVALEFVTRFPGQVRYLEHPGHANRGMSAARNLGLREAQGEFVAFIDSDDVWRPVKLREQVAILDACADAAMLCGAVKYWHRWEGGADKVIPTGHVRDAVSEPPETALRVYPLGITDAPCPSDAMLRRCTVDELGGFDEQFTGLYEDATLFAKLFVTAPVWFSTRIWLDYRQHGGSYLSAIDREHYREVRRQFLDWFTGWVEQNQIPERSKVLKAIGSARADLDRGRVGYWVRRARRLSWNLRR